MINIFNHIDNFIFVISPNRKIKFVNKSVLNKVKIELKDIVDAPVKDCLYSNKNDLNNLINSIEKDEKVNFDFYLKVKGKKYFFNGDLLESSFYGEKSYFIIARDICEKYYDREDLENLLDTINMDCFIKNKKGEYLYVNKRKCDSHNVEKEEIIGQTCHKFFDKEEANYFDRVEKDVIKRKETFCEEKELVFNNNEKHWYEVTIDPVFNEDKSIKNLVGYIRNIDIRKHVEGTLDFTTVKLREINKSLDDDKCEENILDVLNYISEKTMMHFNADGITIVFYKEEKNDFSTLISKGVCLDIKEEEKEEIFKNAYNKYSTREEVEGIKYTDQIKNNDIIVRKLKEKNIYKIGIYNIMMSDKVLGQIIITFLEDTKSIQYGYDYIKTICSHLAVTISNINESNKIKEEFKRYKQKREYLKKCMEISVDIMGRFDIEGNVITLNLDQVKKILGWDKFYFGNIFEVMYSEDRDILCKSIENEKNNAIHGEGRFKCKNGSYKWLEYNVKQYEGANECFFTARDISDKKEYEQKKKLLEETVELEALKNKFFNNISHEFRTPLNIILGTVQLIEKYRYDSSYKLEYLDYHVKFIKSNSYRLLRLVQNLLDLSQIESQYYDVKFGNYDIVNIVEEISMSVATYLKSKNIDLIFDTNCEELIISCDPDKIERIILNLLSNAIKYNKDNNEIEVFVDVDDEAEKVLISIKDHGIGIKKEEIDLIFNEFKKLDDGLTRQCEGSGIGLSIVNEFVRIHNGSIKVDSEVGVGSTFTVELPIVVNSIYENNKINDSRILSSNGIGNNNIERCNIEFSDIYN